MAKSLTNAKEIKINGKAVKQIKDVAKDSVIWSAGGAVEVDDLWIGDGESVFFSKRTQPLAQAIVRGGCHISVDNPTPDNIGTIVCNNGEVSMSNEGVISVSGSPSYFDLNESRYNLPNLFGGLGVQDEYNMLTGVITRNAQVYALRGSMDWVEQSIEGQSYFALPTASYKVIISTHFHQVGTNTPANVGEFVERNGYYVFNYDGVNDNIADFEDYLDECYAAGEAVLVVGARFVSVTEQDDAFNLQQANGRNVVNLFVNDEYSTIALKYKALYPPNNEIWVETTDGTKPTLTSGRLIDSQNVAIPHTTRDNPIYHNTYRVVAERDIYHTSQYLFPMKTKRFWLPQSVGKAADTWPMWGTYPLTTNNITNYYQHPQGLIKTFGYPSRNLSLVNSINIFTSAIMNDAPDGVIKTYNIRGAGSVYGTFYSENWRNVVHYSTAKISFLAQTASTYNKVRRMAMYFNSSFLTQQKNDVPYLAHQFFPIPSFWIL